MNARAELRREIARHHLRAQRTASGLRIYARRDVERLAAERRAAREQRRVG